MGKRYIKLYEQIVNWEWYKNPNVFRVFLHCLLTANFTDGRFEGVDVKRGQLVTSLPSLAKQTSLSIQQVRTSLLHLISTGELTSKAYPKYRVITVVKYDEYQADNRQNNSQSTGNQQATNRQSTGNQQQYKNNKKDIKEEGIDNKTPSVFKPPTLDEVAEYCRERGKGVDPEKWFDFYASKGWMIGKNKMKDWRAAVRTWEKDRDGSPAPKQDARDVHGYEQRSYENEQQAALARMMSDDWGLKQ